VSVNWLEGWSPPEIYRWLRNEVPAGRYAANVLVGLAIVAGVLWLLAVISSFVQPVAPLVKGLWPTVSSQQLWWAIAVGIVLNVVIVVAIGLWVWSVTSKIVESRATDRAVIEVANQKFSDLEKRVVALESHTDISGLQKQLADQIFREQLRKMDVPDDLLKAPELDVYKSKISHKGSLADLVRLKKG
jgi:hypothetical protein